MIDLLGKLASAIATAEGWFSENPDVAPRRNNNPGNLRAAPWLGTQIRVKGFMKFESPASGIAGLYHQLALDIARGLTLEQLITKYAPAGDGNDTENYIKETCRRVGVARDIPLQNYLELERIG